MNARQTFKAAFIAAAVEQGCSDTASVIKLAEDTTAKIKAGADGIGGALINTGGKALGEAFWPTAIALGAAPIVAGALGGTMLGHATDINDMDVDSAKSQELVDAYKRKTDEINKLNKLREAQARPVARFKPSLGF